MPLRYRVSMKDKPNRQRRVKPVKHPLDAWTVARGDGWFTVRQPCDGQLVKLSRLAADPLAPPRTAGGSSWRDERFLFQFGAGLIDVFGAPVHPEGTDFAADATTANLKIRQNPDGSFLVTDQNGRLTDILDADHNRIGGDDGYIDEAIRQLGWTEHPTEIPHITAFHDKDGNEIFKFPYPKGTGWDDVAKIARMPRLMTAEELHRDESFKRFYEAEAVDDAGRPLKPGAPDFHYWICRSCPDDTQISTR